MNRLPEPSEQGNRPLVVIIEDDEAVRESLDGLFRSVGLNIDAFASVEEFLAKDRPDRPGCMVLDVRLPGMSGLEFFENLNASGSNRSVVFISGHADVPMSVAAMKAGAVEFLTKPVRDQDLLNAVHLAIERDKLRRENALSIDSIRVALQSLSALEHQLVALMVKGSQDKQIAAQLGISESKARSSREQVMQTMRAQSLAELVRMIDSQAKIRND